MWQGAPGQVTRRSLLGSAFDGAMHDPNKGAKLEAKVIEMTLMTDHNCNRIMITIES